MVVNKEELWKTIITHEGETFTTSGRGYKPGRGNIRASIPGKKFKYEVSRATTGGGRRYSGPNVDGYGNELWIITIPSGELYRQAYAVIKQQVETAILQSATIDLPLSHRVCHP